MNAFGGSFLSRSDVANWPVAGRLAFHAGTIFVDRADKRSGARAIRAIRRRLEEGGTVIVFPEGSTFAGDELRPFKGGAFAALRGLNVDILPVGLAYPSGTEFVQPDFLSHIRKIAGRPHTRVHLHVGTPFRPKPAARKTSAYAHEIIQDLVHQSRASLKGNTE